MVQQRLHMRNVGFMKPAGYENYLTITELSRKVDKDISWLRKLEKDERIPVAHRVKIGALSVRLWSPQQVREIKRILSTMRPGRPAK